MKEKSFSVHDCETGDTLLVKTVGERVTEFRVEKIGVKELLES